MRALVLALSLSLPAAAAETFPLRPSVGSGSGCRVSADRAPARGPDGTPSLPPGTTLTVEAEGRTAFEVFLVGPSALDGSTQRGRWSGTVTQEGGYKLQFGRLGTAGQPYLSQLAFTVSAP